MSAATVADGQVVELRYTLSEMGEVLESSEREAYVHGSGNLPTGLEDALEGRALGESFSVTLSPPDGYGERQVGAGPQPVPRATFPPDADLKPGIKFGAETPDGAPVTLFIARVDKDVVFVDTNHPYAGKTLTYAIEVMSIRPASAEEKRTGTVG